LSYLKLCTKDNSLLQGSEQGDYGVLKMFVINMNPTTFYNLLKLS